jgi:hypothetical protein
MRFFVVCDGLLNPFRTSDAGSCISMSRVPALIKIASGFVHIPDAIDPIEILPP